MLKSREEDQWKVDAEKKQDVKNFLNPRNEKKFGFGKDNMPQVIDKYTHMYIWELRNVKKYIPAKPWKPTPGAVIFCKITS